MNKQCLRCSQVFDKKPSHSLKAWKLVKYCSRECLKNPMHTCEVCKKEYRIRGIRQLRTRWCSKSCQLLSPKVNYKSHEYRTKPNIRIGVGKRNAQTRSLSWSLTLEEYSTLISKPCFYCNNKLGSVQKEIGAGLDRLVNPLGYTLENVIPCCGQCNRIRSDIFTVEETKVAVQAILKYRQENLSGQLSY